MIESCLKRNFELRLFHFCIAGGDYRDNRAFSRNKRQLKNAAGKEEPRKDGNIGCLAGAPRLLHMKPG